MEFIENGGWHFSYLKTPAEVEKKLKSYLHHIDYDLDPLGIKKIKKIMDDKKTIYNLKVDQKINKFDSQNKLLKINSDQLPKYIFDNLDKFNNWID